MIAAFIGEKYLQIEGFEEEIYNFMLMKSFFVNTKEALSDMENSSEEYNARIKELGISALEENTKWVVLHDKYRAKPILE